MSEWQQVRCGDIFKIKHGFAFKGAYFSDDPGAIVLTPGNFGAGGGLKLRPGKDRSYTADFPPEFRLQANDLLVVMTDLTQEAAILGAPAIVPEHLRCLHNQRLGKIVDVDEVRADCRFLYYVFNTHEYREHLRATATGSTVKHTSPSRIYEHKIYLPPLVTQRRIASILGAYDDLIEVNRRRIALLEEMAGGLFEGLVSAPFGGLPQATGDNKKMAVPTGWQIVTLGDVADLIMGQSPPSELLNRDGNGLPFHQGVTDFGVLFLGNRVFCTPPNRKKVAVAGDILFSVRAPVGRINLATEDVVLGRGVCSIRSKIGTSSFLLAHLRATFYATDLIGNGAIYKAVGREDIERIGIALPPLAIREQAEKQLSPLYTLHWDIEQSNRNLAASRDLLLPRLISGQLSVTQAERELEAA